MVKIIDNILSFQLIESMDNSDDYVNISDWKCDYINNNMITTINANDTDNMNIIIRKIRIHFAGFKNITRIIFSEHEGKIYIHVLVITDILWSEYDYYIIEPINDSYIIKHYDNYKDEKNEIFNRTKLAKLAHQISIKSLSYPIEHGMTDKIEKLRVNTIIFNCTHKGRIDEKIYYGIICDKLQIYKFDSSLNIETSIVKLDAEIQNAETLKNKLYMILKNKSLCTYDTETGLMETEYSYDSNTIIEKYGQLLVFKKNGIPHYILSEKPKIINIKCHDIFFKF